MSTRTPVEQENTICRWLRWAIEAVALVMVVGSPWAFGCADPPYEFYLHVCVGIIAVLWGVRMMFQKRLQWQFSAVALSLLAIFAIGLYQLVPLPRNLLATISPSSASLIENLLPDRPEVLPFGLEVDASAKPPNHTLSVYPAATRYALFRLLAVLVLFETVRNVCANRKSLERLSVCAFSNAVLLSFVGILQFLSSPPDVIYWTFKVRQSIFGPFLCRNHFPFYVNIGLGLGVGLFFATMNRQETETSSSNRKSGRRRQNEFDYPREYGAAFPKSLLLGLGDWIQSLLSTPKALWIGAGLAVIVCADFLSLSRGGMLALSVAVFACVVYKSITLSGRSISAGLLVMLVLAFGLINWLGWSLVEARLGTLISKDALSNRIPMWWDGVLAFKDFPIFGTGYGTFEYVEPLHRTFADDYVMFFDHAHNDYLEAAVEGGVFRLCAALCAIGFVYVAGIRALRKLGGQRGADLVLGALFGFTTIFVHSFGEFGLFTPAITVLAAIVVAHICASEVWSREISGRRRDSDTVRSVPFQLRLAGFAPAAGVLVALIVAAMLIAEGYRADWQCRFRNAAERLRNAGPDASERRIALLNEAIRWGPESAWAHLELGEVYLNAYQSEVDKLEPFGNIQTLFGFTFPTIGPGLSGLESIGVLGASEPVILAQLEYGIERDYLGPALRCFVAARNLCPLLARAQLRLVGLSAKLEHGDEPSQYLERARILAGYDPEFWFLAGALALADNRPANWPADCWPLWKHSLAISPKHFEAILNQSRLYLKPDELLVKLLPDNPRLVVESANRLLPQPQNEADKKTRKEYFQRAIDLLRLESGDITAEGWAVRASIAHELGNDTDAIIAMRRAITMDPRFEDLRLELAKALMQQGDWPQAMREIKTVLTRQPWNEQAKSLEKQLKEALPR